jgi:hypothetical protein
MAALRCCALALVSFWRSSKSLTPVFLVIASASSLYLVSSASAQVSASPTRISVIVKFPYRYPQRPEEMASTHSWPRKSHWR